MRIKLTLFLKQGSLNILPVNYQYPLSAAIYKIISLSDESYAAFLHQQGYRKKNSLKTFKLFTFSDISTPFEINGDRLCMKTKEAKLVVCFHIPEASANFVKGLFIDQQIDIADKKSKASFIVNRVEALPLWSVPVESDKIVEVTLKPISPMVIGITNDKGNYDFLPPNDHRFISMVTHHIGEKYRVVYGEEIMENDLKEFEVAVLNADKAKSRLITIKAQTPEETKIRGFMGFQLYVRAKSQLVELALNAGIGVYGSQGFGCVDMVDIKVS